MESTQAAAVVLNVGVPVRKYYQSRQLTLIASVNMFMHGRSVGTVQLERSVRLA
jgi:hypothetical protein